MSHQYEHGGHARIAAWHATETEAILIKDPSIIKDPSRFATACNMDFSISKVPAYVMKEDISDQGIALYPEPVPHQYHLVRSSDQKVVSPRTVGEDYTQLSPNSVLEDVSYLVEHGYATMDGMFSLRDGSTDVIVLRLDFDVPEEKIDERVYYAVIQNFHGCGSCRGRLTAVRVVCANTERAAFSGGADWTLSHRQNVKDSLTWAIRTWETLRSHVLEKSKVLGLFIDARIDVPKTIMDIFGVDMDSTKKARNKADELIALADRGSPNLRASTAYDAYNAFTAYATHSTHGKYGKDIFRRIDSHFNGGRGQLEQKAANHLVGMVKAL
jgi:hypothetical protein